MRRNCPNCGATTSEPYCPYCGTPLYTTEEALFGCIGKTVHMFYENDDGTLHAFDILVSSIEQEQETETYYTDSSIYTNIVPMSELMIRATLRDPNFDFWKQHIIKHRKGWNDER